MNIQMIGISHCPKSRYYSEICLDAWDRLGHSVNWFEATTPNSIPENGELRFGKDKWAKISGANPWTPTEKAIWYSHFRLWNYVIDNGPTYIIEHDTYPTKPLFHFEGIVDAAVFSIFPRYNGAWLGTEEHISPGSGYYLTPHIAKQMVKNVKLYGETRIGSGSTSIGANVDSYILRTMQYVWNTRDYKHINKLLLQYCSCFQLYNEDMGTSAEHNP